MNTKNKILKVLEKVPSGTKLYSTAFGRLVFNGIVATIDGIKIELVTKNEVCITYFSDGKYKKEGEVTLYPSKEMRDWDKFAWNKGDVLVGNNGKRKVLFKTWENNSYTKFVGFHCLITIDNEEVKYDNGTTVFNAKDFEGIEAEDAAQTYINTIEKHLGGKLNLETLEVEKPKFKDGDILTCPATTFCSSSTFIFKGENTDGYAYHAAVGISEELYINSGNTWCSKHENVRYATSEEKTKLFNALTKEGKRWNAEEKVIEDIKPAPKKQNATYKKESDIQEHEFQPFEKVLVRDQKTDKWLVDLYGSKRKVGHYNYICIGGCCVYCIPYEGNERLLDTSKDPEEK